MILTRAPEFSWSELARGLEFRMPGEGLATAVAVFGITGVGASELFMYPYWCVEKGYARYSGKRESTGDWERRARGWVRVMNVDIVASMIVYTVATVAFYGPTGDRASKVAVGIIEEPEGGATVLERWFSETGDVRHDHDMRTRHP